MVKSRSYNLVTTLRARMSKNGSLQDISVKVVSTIGRVSVRPLLLILLTFMLAGCFKEGIGDKRLFGKINISTNWGDISDIPGGLVVYFYPEGDPSDSLVVFESLGKPIVEYISSQGAEITLPIGTYYAFVYNDYSEYLLFRNMDLRTTAEVYLEDESKAPFSKLNTKAEYISELEDFYKCQIGIFTLTKELPEHEVLVRPRLRTITLELDIPVDGIHNVLHARGSLSGIGNAVSLSTGKTDVNNVANLVFDFLITETGITAKVKCFGIPGFQNTKSRSDEELKNILDVAFILRDGSSILDEHKFDVTENITYEVAEKGGFIPYFGNKPLIEDVVIENEGGFDIDVGGWDKVDKDLEVND